ncbi:hypothetical protein C0993_000087 [Termitomyces sp. T159_Od127]|nr:hypothetical protein C0993_000087 [Termitomyces sp. T159_Od127]
MYTLPISSTTSLSDDDDYDEENTKPTFDSPQTRHQPASGPAQWSIHSDCNRASSASPMTQLPAEILIHILKHLHSTRDVLNAVRVSRKWCECSVELLWHKPVFPKHETLKKMSRRLVTPNQTFTYARFIRRLNLSTLSSHVKDDILTTFVSCDRLERLTLINCENITDSALSRVLPCFPNLVAIDLTGVINTTDEAVIGLAHAAKRLQGINLAGCSKVSDEGILAFAKNCPMLRRVKLSGLSSLTDTSISAVAKSCPLLLEIDLNHCCLITDTSLRDIWIHSTHMREMRVSHCSQLTDAAFPASPRLEGFLYPDSRHVFPSSSNEAASELPPLVLPRPLEHLRMLDLTMCSLVTDDAIEGIVHYAPKIRNLNQDCVLLTDMSVFELSALPKLRRIGLVRVNNLTDEAIYALGERHTSLERIHLSYCDQISVLAIHFLLQKLDKLTHLSLTGVPAFRQPELQVFCRDPPKDFNSTQQSTFCVYSGKGIYQLRTFLSALFDHITDLNGTDDTEYEDEDEDDAYAGEDTPEPEDGVNDGEEEVNSRHLHTESIISARGYRQPVHPPPSHEFAFRRDRPVRSATIPASHNSLHPPPSVDIEGAANRLNAQILAAQTSGRQFQIHGHRSMVDRLPIVEISTSPPFSEAFNRSSAINLSNASGLFGTHHEGTTLAAWPVAQGAMTPDYDFAEIGHGRRTQSLQQRVRSDAEENIHRRHSHQERTSDNPVSNIEDGTLTLASTQTHTLISSDTAWPYTELNDPSTSSKQPLNDAQQSHQPSNISSADGRGRSVKRNIRNTLQAAESYASSFLFGRSSSRVGESSGSSPNRASGSGINGRRR